MEPTDPDNKTGGHGKIRRLDERESQATVSNQTCQGRVFLMFTSTSTFCA